MLSMAEKRYLAEGFIDVLSTMGVRVKYFPLLGNIQDKSGKIRMQWDENNGVETWGNLSYNKYQDYSIGKGTETSIESRLSFLISDFDTFLISPKPKDAVDVTKNGVTKRYVIIGPDNSADFPELFYVANVDSLEHINP